MATLAQFLYYPGPPQRVSTLDKVCMVLRQWSAMSYDRMEEKEKQLKEEVEKLLTQAAETDAAEDALYGKGNRGDELTGELARRESRLKKIAEAKAALEQEAREHAEAAKKAAEEKQEERRKMEEARGKKFGGRPPQIPDNAQIAVERRGANHRGRRTHPGEQRQAATGAHAGAGGAKPGYQTGGCYRRCGLLQRRTGKR